MFPYTQHLGLETKKKLWLILQYWCGQHLGDLFSKVITSTNEMTSLFFFFKKSLFYASIDTIAIVCLRTGPDKAPRLSNDTWILSSDTFYVSSTNYFQIVRWQCCLYWSTTGNFLERPVLCLLFLTSTCPNMALYRIAIKTRLLTL